MPPRRTRLPGAALLSAMSVGELKNTIESRNELSTSPTAMARTPRLEPIQNEAPLFPCQSTVQSELFGQFADAAQTIIVSSQRRAGVGGRVSALSRSPSTE